MKRILTVVFITAASLVGAQTAKEVVRNVDRSLASVKTMRIAFEEVFVWKLTGESQSVRGEGIV